MRTKSEPYLAKPSSDQPKMKLEEHSSGSPVEQVLEYPREDSVILLTKERVSENSSADTSPDACTNKEKEKIVDFHPMDDGEDSDVMEHDVKVCDICGDAGREDLLAVCSRCTDGAEHTYCMRDMLEKVPEGDWLCEECKFEDEMKTLSVSKVRKLDGNEKSCSSGQTSLVSDISKAKASDAEGDELTKERSNLKKRHTDEAEVSSAVKKQAIEPNLGLPKPHSPRSIPTLSRERSFKNVERGKQRSGQTLSSDSVPGEDSSDQLGSLSSAHRMQTSQGSFLKSNSFNTLNVKPKLGLVDDGSPSKQRLLKEPDSVSSKEGSRRPVSKSLSFRSTNPGRPNGTEPKVKMLSPNLCRGPDLKALKSSKERPSFERKNSFKSDRRSFNPATSSSATASKTDLKPLTRGEPTAEICINSSTEVKDADASSIAIQRSSSFVSRRATDVLMSLGDPKQQSSDFPGLIGVSSGNRTCNAEEKPNMANLREEPDRPSSYTDEGLQDGRSLPRESTYVSERKKDRSGNLPRQGCNGLVKTISCQRCKEIGHSTENCKTNNSEGVASDDFAPKTLRETTSDSIQIKDAIQRAMIAKPSLCRKRRVLDQYDDSSIQTDSDISQDNPSSSGVRRIVCPPEEVQDGCTVQLNSAAEPLKHNANVNGKLLTGMRCESSASRPGDAAHQGPSDLSSGSLTAALVPRAAIPEYEHIWQGVFEIQRNGRIIDLWEGIQAHLSTCASPKVPQAVNKFPRRVLLNEVPRLSAWPIQFIENGVTEHNIALYFFAKDLGSYQKGYRYLLDNMMKNDLALMGNFDGVELLIFPSNQLPTKCQRWNMLFFLWGVFRGKANSQQHSSTVGNQCSPVLDLPKPIMSSPEKICSVRPLAKESEVCGDVIRESEAPVSGEPSFALPETMKGDHVETSQLLSCEQKPIDHQQTGVEQNINQERSRSGTLLEECTDCEPKSGTEFDSSTKASTTLEHVSAQSYTSPGNHQQPLNLEEAPVDCVVDVDTTSNCKDKFKLGMEMSNGSKDARCPQLGGMGVEESSSNSWSLNNFAESKAVAHAGGANSCQVASSNEHDVVGGYRALKTLKSGIDRVPGHGGTECASDELAAETPRVAFGSSLDEKVSDKVLTGIVAREITGNCERYFFPIDQHPGKDINVVDDSLQWRTSANEGQLHERFPNLDLALGADIKSSGRAVPPFAVGKSETKNIKDHHFDKARMKGEEDDSSTSLSLSLSFPFSDGNIQTIKAASSHEQLLPKKQQVSSFCFSLED